MTTLKDAIAKNGTNKIHISSNFITKNLTPDDMSLNCIKNISSILQNKEEKTKLFHTSRIVSKGAHYSYCITEHNNEGIKRPLLINKTAFQQELGDLDYTDSATIDFFQGVMVGKENQMTEIWKSLIEKYNIFPYSQAYAGFQFGQFSGQLGDGRVVNLLDINEQSIQVKGSGLTPFSRFADGKATLKASVREFIISESLHSIGIPTTRGLILSYIPDIKALRGLKRVKAGTVTRFAKSWVRLGNFDLQRWRQDLDAIIKLSDYCIEEVMPKPDSFIPIENLIDIEKGNDAYDVLDITKYDEFLRNVAIANASNVAKWQAYGFTNGVLNTDNTSILGISMDYGPFSFIDTYDEDWTPNKDDSTKRYSLGNQPKVIWWNLLRFAESLTMLIGSGNKHLDLVKKDPQSVNETIAQYMTDRTIKLIEYVEKEYDFYYKLNYVKLMVQRLGLCSKKLGLEIPVTSLSQEDFKSFDKKLDDLQDNLIEKLLSVMKTTKVDYNNFFLDFQNIGTNSLINEDKTFSQELYKCFTNVHEGVNLYVNNETSDAIDKLFISEVLDTDFKLYKDLEAFVTEYKKIWKSINNDVDTDIKEIKLSVSTKVNPYFIPRHHHFNEVDQSLESDAEAISKLQKLYLMSTNPYNPELWNEKLLPEVEKRWIDPADICKDKNSFSQCGCSS